MSVYEESIYKGEAGPQGPQGPQGPEGPEGPEGQQGPQGNPAINSIVDILSSSPANFSNVANGSLLFESDYIPANKKALFNLKLTSLNTNNNFSIRIELVSDDGTVYSTHFMEVSSEFANEARIIQKLFYFNSGVSTRPVKFKVYYYGLSNETIYYRTPLSLGFFNENKYLILNA